MFKPDLSLCADDLRMEIREALLTARRLGFRAVDLAATEGTISPAEMPRSAQRHFVRHLDGLGLRLSSLRGPVGGPGYGDGAGGERRLDMVLDIMRLARQLGVPVVSTTMGSVGDDSAAASRNRDALGVMADQADRIGVTLAIETSGIAAADLNDVLRQIGCPKLTACCDSGAMLMGGDDPHRVADTLPGRIGLVRARDAMSGTPEAAGHEVAFGRGELDSRRFLAALATGGFDGALVLTDTASGQAARNLSAARERLERLLAEPPFDG